jgi:hypothetical protein
VNRYHITGPLVAAEYGWLNPVRGPVASWFETQRFAMLLTKRVGYESSSLMSIAKRCVSKDEARVPEKTDYGDTAVLCFRVASQFSKR